MVAQPAIYNKQERTLVLIKPGAVQRGLVGKIIDRFENKGLKLVALKLILVSVYFEILNFYLLSVMLSYLLIRNEYVLISH